MTKEKKGRRHKDDIPEHKKKTVDDLAKQMKESRTVLLASCKGLPGKQFHEIKKKLRGKAKMSVAKKTIITRAIESVDKGALQNLKKEIGADMVLLFSGMDPFELSSVLIESQTPAKAKAGDISPDDIVIEPGPTDLPAGPAISELSAVGAKVAVKEGKLEITQGATVAKAGDKITPEVASILGKLDITPMKVGFMPIAAYDAQDDAIYLDIKIDKAQALEALQEALSKALGFAVNIDYPAKETVSYFISKAAGEERALDKVISGDKEEKPATEDKEKPSEKEEGKPDEGEEKEEAEGKGDVVPGEPPKQESSAVEAMEKAMGGGDKDLNKDGEAEEKK